MMTVEVAYAEPEEQRIVAVDVAEGTTVEQAIELSAIRDLFPALQQQQELEVGIFSKKCLLTDVLRAGDRVEIYRPLQIDPKEARRLKAEVAARRKAEAES